MEARIAPRLARGDERAMEELYAETGRAAFAVIVRIVRDRDHAEDVQQQTYAEVWRRAAQFDPRRGSMLGWVLTIARSRALDHVRRRSDQPVDGEVLTGLGGGAPDDGFQGVLDRALIGEALARLPEQERTLLRMRFWDDLTQAEIAERTGQPLGTVKSRMRSGLQTLRELVEVLEGPR